MGRILNSVKRFFVQANWAYNEDGEQPCVRAQVGGKYCSWTCQIHANEELEQVVMYSVCPIRVPESKRASVAEFIIKVNSGTPVGCVDMDYSNGEVRVRTGMDVDGIKPIKSLIANLVFANCALFDQVFPALASLVFGNISVGRAVRLVKRGDDVFEERDEECPRLNVCKSSYSELN